MAQTTLFNRLIHFLKNDLMIPEASIALAEREESTMPNLLPMVLWQYGLITLEQLEQIFDWFETA